MAHSFSDEHILQQSIRRRWGAIDWDLHFPWWRRPAKVRDSHVRRRQRTLQRRVISADAVLMSTSPSICSHQNRGDLRPIAGARQLTDPALDIMNKYDEIWFFGIESTPNLTAAGSHS